MAKIKLVSVEDDFQWLKIALLPDELKVRTKEKNQDNWAKNDCYELLFLRQAVKELHEFIGWGRMDYHPNRVEQIGLLSGLHYEDEETGKRYCVVMHVLPIRDAKGSSAYIEYSPDMMYKAIQQLNENNLTEEIPAVILGWFHTHPNGLTPFMSGTDMRTQHSVFNAEYNFSVVLNPHSRSWKAFRGYDAVDTRCRWLDTNKLSDIAVMIVAEKMESDGEPEQMDCIEDSKGEAHNGD